MKQFRLNDYKHISEILWQQAQIKFWERHPSGGLNWWSWPLEYQPDELKVEMYDIFYKILEQWSKGRLDHNNK